MVALAAAGTAEAEFPYPAPSGGDPSDYTQYRVENQTPNDLAGKLEWMYAATPEDSPESQPNNASPFELGGIRGAHLADAKDSVDTAWETSTGRPDVGIAILDSGIKWNDRGAMVDLRRKTRISKGEAPVPQHGRATPLEALPGGKACVDLVNAYDANGDGVFNVSDYACDPRVEIAPAARVARGQAAGVGPADLLDPQDILIAFSDGTDADSNGYVDDMVGWDFLDNDNDPYDDVQYGHGTGEARDSTAEANNGGAEGGGELAACPNCVAVHMRVGDSFIADVNRFAQATIYATDNDVSVVQSALGTLNNSNLARQSVDYAYDHGVAVVVSAADEAAQHNNQPSLPKTILVNSVTKYDEFTASSRSYLHFNGCTNFNSKITVSIPSVSCSSDAVGRAAGMAGLIISAATNAVAQERMEPHPDCRRTNGERCAISPNEVRQLMASGVIDGQTQVDDVNFEARGVPPVRCPAPGCTDPFAAVPLLTSPPPTGRPVASPLPTRSYPARFGHDQFYGYGRVNMLRSTEAADAGVVPPEVEVTSPEWYEQVDPRGDFAVRGTVYARGEGYTCEVYVAPGAYPNDREAPDGDFQRVDSGACDGETSRTGELDGLLASVDVEALKGAFPPGTAGSFDGRETGGTGVQPHSGRPNTAPYGFVVKVIARTVQEGAGPNGADRELMGQDRRQAFLHRDADLLEDFPMEMLTDGASSPLFVDLDGDNENELVFGTSDGFVRALERDGTAVAGWEAVRGDRLPLHDSGRAFASGGVSEDFGGAILASPAAGDLDRDGSPEIIAADLEGKVYVWNAKGERVRTMESNIAFSGKPLDPFVDVRKGRRNRTQHGFIGSPVLGDIDEDGGLEIVAAAMDRHLYAWNPDGSLVDGYPVLLVDETKVESIDDATHAVRFSDQAGDELDQGAIVNTPAIANVVGDAQSPPEIVIGTNEEYRINQGNEGAFNAGPVNAAAITALQQAGGQADLGVANANGRLYAVHADGEDHPDGPYVEGWPVKIGLLMAQLLPVVGEGINGSPVIAPLTCASGGRGNKIGVIPAAGLGYVFNGDGTSCLGQGPEGQDNALQSDVPAVEGGDVNRFPAVGLPAFGRIGVGDAARTALVAPVAGLVRALDLAFKDYQGGFDGIAAWDPEAGGQYLPNFPAQVNDLSFLTGPAVADVDGVPGEEVVAGTASMDLQAFSASGEAPPGAALRWPRLTGDWMVATPLIGSFGQRETEDGTRQVVVGLTRRGTVFAWNTPAPACSPSSSPRFHHDNHNSGHFERDAVAPGKPEDVSVDGRTLFARAPGDDLLCGRAERYELAQSDSPITGANLAGAEPIAGAPRPSAAGTLQAITLPANVKRFVALRAVDEQGNVGRTVAVDTGASAGGGQGRQGPGGRGRGGGRTGDSVPCFRAARSARGNRVGRAGLARRRSSVRRTFGASGRYRRFVDRYCLRDGGVVRVAYPSRRELRRLSRSERRRIGGESIFVLTTSRSLRMRGVRRGTSERAMRRRIGRGPRVRVGRNTWYFRKGRNSRHIFKVQGGRVREMGIADARLTAGTRRAKRFFRQGR